MLQLLLCGTVDDCAAQQSKEEMAAPGPALQWAPCTLQPLPVSNPPALQSQEEMVASGSNPDCAAAMLCMPPLSPAMQSKAKMAAI